MINKAINRFPKIFWTKSVNKSLLLRRYSCSTGTNAWEKAPSANSLLKKLGILKATKKESVLEEAPK